MDAARWQIIETVFSAVSGRSGEERERVLDEHCSGDPDLRREVVALLDTVDSADHYFDKLADRIGVPLDPDATTERFVGKRVGRYRLERLVGRGGMGAVYLATRDDDQFEMRAALKILPLGVDSAETRHRFLAERQILATLQHPNIARLIDGGVTDDGTPFFAMEFVEGTPIAEYSDTLQLPIAQRLSLFLDVCQAVEYAHQSLVVHRDLKPSNILVTDAGHVKLLDFGIARVIDGEGDGPSITHTRRGRPMTLAYASPEQIRGESITTVSDVYSLGVLLYTLLAGRHPYRIPSRSIGEVERVVCDTIPPPPSHAVRTCRTDTLDADNETSADEIARRRGTTGPRLQRELAGDLDTIVMTALRKEPDRRYASVRHLADDLRRFGTGHPVTAQKDTLRYRAMRFVLRNKLGVAAAGTLAVLFIALAVVSVRYAVTTARQSQQVAQEAATADLVSSFLIDLFEVSNPGQVTGDSLRARTMLDRGAASIENLASQPEVQARMLYTLGRVYANLGLYEDATDLHKRALAVRREVLADDHLDIAASLVALGETERASRAFDSALPYYRDAIAMQRRLMDNPLQLAETMQGLALNLRELGQLDSAEVLMDAVLAIRRGALGRDDPVMMSTLSALAYLLRAQEKYDSAQVLYEEVAARYRRHGDSFALDLGRVLNNLAYLHRVRGDYQRAEAIYREALPLERRWGVPALEVTLSRNLASVIELQGRIDEAEHLLEERLEVVRANWPEGHWQRGVAHSLIGVVRLRQADSTGAEESFRETVRIYEGTLGPEHGWTARAKTNLAGTLLRPVDFEEAEALLLTAHPVLESIPSAREWLKESLTLAAMMYRAWGRTDEAARYERQVSGLDAESAN